MGIPGRKTKNTPPLKFGVSESFFYVFGKSLLCSTTLHLFDQNKQATKKVILLKLLQFKITILFEY